MTTNSCLARCQSWKVQFEQTAIRDETASKAAGASNIDQTMSAVFLSQKIDLHVRDFRAPTSNYDKIPDIAAASQATGDLGLIRELKTP